MYCQDSERFVLSPRQGEVARIQNYKLFSIPAPYCIGQVNAVAPIDLLHINLAIYVKEMLIFFFEQSYYVSSDSSSDKSATQQTDSSFDLPPAKENAVVDPEKEPEAAVEPENEPAVGQAAKAAVEPPAKDDAVVEPEKQPNEAVEPGNKAAVGQAAKAAVEPPAEPEAAIEPPAETEAADWLLGIQITLFEEEEVQANPLADADRESEGSIVEQLEVKKYS